MQLLVSHPFVNIYLHEYPAPVLEAEWLGFAGSQQFRQAIEQGLQLAQQYQITGWIANDRQLRAVRPADLAWVSEYLLPALDDMGLRRLALIESEDVLNRLTINNMYHKSTPQFSFEMSRFELLSEARAWAAAADPAE
ncbi:hypothetical protein [Hymenobacter sp. CRA2]|uniref:hypothetical protein n=1 Tax=Hymenobacter sp. CRA2 TaxID=1955620 RepID=UPI00098EA67D|nr:hypothetical protein [Hymenobacter sp. CRA2]OON69065.1 hypothetical protein B0919_10160 [Hymenobacter sp. CRA2]